MATFSIDGGPVNNYSGAIQRFGNPGTNTHVFVQVKPTQDTDCPGTVTDCDVTAAKSPALSRAITNIDNFTGFVELTFATYNPSVGDVISVTGTDYTLRGTYLVTSAVGTIALTSKEYPACAPPGGVAGAGIAGAIYTQQDDLNRIDSEFIIKGFTTTLNGDPSGGIKPGTPGQRSCWHYAKSYLVETGQCVNACTGERECGTLVDEFAGFVDYSLCPQCIYTIQGCPTPKRLCPGIGDSELRCYDANNKATTTGNCVTPPTQGDDDCVRLDPVNGVLVNLCVGGSGGGIPVGP